MASEWSDPQRVSDYLAREIPHRDLAEALLLEALPARIELFADLGAGDGRLLALVRHHHPEARGLGLEISAPMLARGRERFRADASIELHEHDLADPLTNLAPLREAVPPEAIVSALAIHHLADERKRSLFAEIHDLLGAGGVFVNFDLVSSPTPELHERFRRAIGRERDDPSDRLAGLADQLEWLHDAGFATVDCRFKWRELTLFVATRGV